MWLNQEAEVEPKRAIDAPIAMNEDIGIYI
jgi:hypothetical protein